MSSPQSPLICRIPSPAAQSGASRPSSPSGDLITTVYHQTIQKNGIIAICADSNQSEFVKTLPTEPPATTCRDRARALLSRARTDGGDIQQNNEISEIVLKLRGGGDGADRRKSKRLADDERVPATTWYFAGGRGPPPTGKQLRDRKAKGEAYIQRKRDGGEAKKAARELKEAGVKIEGGGNDKRNSAFAGLRRIFGQKKKKAKTRGDEENKDKEDEKPKDGDGEAVSGAGTSAATSNFSSVD